jgi:hypothetical protein
MGSSAPLFCKEMSIIHNFWSDKSIGSVKKKGSSAIQKRVDEVNKLIKEVNDKGLDVTDSQSTLESSYRYKPLKYTRGLLYVTYEKLNPFNNRWTKSNERWGKDDQREVLTMIAREHRKVLNRFKKYGY